MSCLRSLVQTNRALKNPHKVEASPTSNIREAA